MDRRGRDQFVIRYGDETEVCWNDHQKQQAEQVRCLSTADRPAELHPLSGGQCWSRYACMEASAYTWSCLLHLCNMRSTTKFTQKLRHPS